MVLIAVLLGLTMAAGLALLAARYLRRDAGYLLAGGFAVADVALSTQAQAALAGQAVRAELP